MRSDIIGLVDLAIAGCATQFTVGQRDDTRRSFTA